MSSMLSVVHVPVASGFHEIVQVPPCWKISPGPGAKGVTSAKATKAKERTKVERALRDNIGDERRGNCRENENKNENSF